MIRFEGSTQEKKEIMRDEKRITNEKMLEKTVEKVKERRRTEAIYGESLSQKEKRQSQA